MYVYRDMCNISLTLAEAKGKAAPAGVGEEAKTGQGQRVQDFPKRQFGLKPGSQETPLGGRHL